MAPPVVISGAELDRIRKQVATAKIDTAKEVDRNRLKQLSDERASQWLNTISVRVRLSAPPHPPQNYHSAYRLCWKSILSPPPGFDRQSFGMACARHASQHVLLSRPAHAAPHISCECEWKRCMIVGWRRHLSVCGLPCKASTAGRTENFRPSGPIRAQQPAIFSAPARDLPYLYFR